MAVHCPGCRAPMTAAHYARRQGGTVELDFCFSCQLIWLDQHESAQLAPQAVVQLFELLHVHKEEGRYGLPDKFNCVRCGVAMQLTHDAVRNNRFVYHRCSAGHGRLIGFWHFLREKQFVRDLSAPERQALAVTVAQVKCTGCGAPVDIRKDDACGYCRAPVAVLDKEAVAKALEGYRAVPIPQAAPTPAARPAPAPAQAGNGSGNLIDAIDLVGTGLAVVLALLD
ncbi:zf-TFIIB domain-containing protein [Chitinimonas viridis]|uniref:Zf-TFIIB domain-containing protein n=2 Tax=Chitinimonas viridis TaxID=664880 RepID=A0ABT8B8Y6_9NEIS|nr:zf-TFIIB domain-containing protein [Chitinimonas viridis]MDN3577949.1 zf-TFIIB domain-containing protein [Chitinimonas viridis]